MKKCMFVGSFDPITLGHVDVINRSCVIFDKVVVAIGKNVGKKSLLTDEEKVELVKKTFEGNSNVEVVLYNEFTGELCRKLKVGTIVRGVRTSKDFDYEYAIDMVNKKLFPEIDTVYLASRQQNLHISSSYVREILAFNGDIEQFVPKCVNEFFLEKNKKNS